MVHGKGDGCNVSRETSRKPLTWVLAVLEYGTSLGGAMHYVTLESRGRGPTIGRRAPYSFSSSWVGKLV